MLPQSLDNLVTELSKLPSIGYKTAERLAFYMTKRPPAENNRLSIAINNLRQGVKFCTRCFNFASDDLCSICQSPNRDEKTLCIVARPFDIVALEKTKEFNGLYHVLAGTLKPMDNIGPDQLHIAELEKRLEAEEIIEIILALNPDVEGDTTSLYLAERLQKFPDIKITRIARGLPSGGDLEYADELTLQASLKNRKAL